MTTIELVLIGTMTITAYRPVAWQTKPQCTNRSDCRTSIGENVSELGVAVSQDLLRSKRVKYGDVLWIPGIGYRKVFDTMNARHKNSVDIFVYEKWEEHKIGTRHLKIYRIGEPNGL